MGFHTSGQTQKMKGLQSTYMGALFGTFGSKSLAPGKKLEPLRMEIQTLVKKLIFFSTKYSKFDKKTLIVYFNGLLPSPLKRSLGNNLST